MKSDERIHRLPQPIIDRLREVISRIRRLQRVRGALITAAAATSTAATAPRQANDRFILMMQAAARQARRSTTASNARPAHRSPMAQTAWEPIAERLRELHEDRHRDFGQKPLITVPNAEIAEPAAPGRAGHRRVADERHERNRVPRDDAGQRLGQRPPVV